MSGQRKRNPRIKGDTIKSLTKHFNMKLLKILYRYRSLVNVIFLLLSNLHRNTDHLANYIVNEISNEGINLQTVATV